MDKAKTSVYLVASKFIWVYQIHFLIIVILIMSPNIRLNEQCLMGGIGVASANLTEGVRRDGLVSNDSNGNVTTTTEETQTVGIYDYIDLNDVVKKCPEAADCPASEKYMLVCGSDGGIYENIGVLACAQRCDRGLKLTEFGPCEGAEPISRPTPPPISRSTLVNYFGISVDPKTQVKFSAANDLAVIRTLKENIKARMRDHPLPPEWKKWCKKNPDKCYPGFDPRFNPALYLIPVSGTDEGSIDHEKINQKK